MSGIFSVGSGKCMSHTRWHEDSEDIRLESMSEFDDVLCVREKEVRDDDDDVDVNTEDDEEEEGEIEE